MSAMYGYDPNTDYQALINEAVKNKDFARAAIYEQQRNEKIAGEGMTGVQSSSLYTHYLPGSFQGGYTNPYQGMIDEAIGKLTDQSAFKKAYLREADRTMEDTLAQYGTMTGGIPSTQAVAAASQAADYQKSKLAETLQAQQAQNVSLLLSAGQAAASDYQARISEALARWNQLGYADDHVSSILGVAIGTPTTDQSYLNWQQGQQDKSDAYSIAMNMLQTGQMPSADVLAAAGISAEDAAALAGSYVDPNAYNLALAMLQAGQMPSEAVLAAAGISAEDAAKIQQAYTPVYSGGGGGGGREPDTEEFDPLGGLDQKTYQTLWASATEAAAKGDYSGFLGTVSMYHSLGYNTDYLEAMLKASGIIIPGFNDYFEEEETEKGYVSPSRGAGGSTKVTQMIRQ